MTVALALEHIVVSERSAWLTINKKDKLRAERNRRPPKKLSQTRETTSHTANTWKIRSSVFGCNEEEKSKMKETKTSTRGRE